MENKNKIGSKKGKKKMNNKPNKEQVYGRMGGTTADKKNGKHQKRNQEK